MDQHLHPLIVCKDKNDSAMHPQISTDIHRIADTATNRRSAQPTQNIFVLIVSSQQVAVFFPNNADRIRQSLNLMSEAIPEKHATGTLFPAISGHKSINGNFDPHYGFTRTNDGLMMLDTVGYINLRLDNNIWYNIDIIDIIYIIPVCSEVCVIPPVRPWTRLLLCAASFPPNTVVQRWESWILLSSKARKKHAIRFPEAKSQLPESQNRSK